MHFEILLYVTQEEGKWRSTQIKVFISFFFTQSVFCHLKLRWSSRRGFRD